MNINMIRDVAQRSGLLQGVVVALLNAGYTFVEGIDKSPSWMKVGK